MSTGSDASGLPFDLNEWNAALMTRLVMTAPDNRPAAITDAIEEAKRLVRAGDVDKPSIIDVLEGAARIYRVSAADIEAARANSRSQPPQDPVTAWFRPLAKIHGEQGCESLHGN